MGIQKDVLVPDIGDFENVDVIEVLVKEGDVVQIDDSLLTLETDKATMDIPSPFAGTVKSILVGSGSKISKGDKIFVLETAELGQAPASEMPQAASAPIEPVTPESTSVGTQNTANVEVDLVLPDLGTNDAVEVIELVVSVGSAFEKDATLFTLESDKASLDIPAPMAGTLTQLNLKKGDKVHSGQAVGKILVKNAASAPNLPTQVKEVASAPVAPAAQTAYVSPDQKNAQHKGLRHAGPATRRLARELGVELMKLSGSGRKGRVLTTDIQAFVKNLVKQAESGQIGSGNGLQVAAKPKVDFSKFGQIEIKPLSRIKKLTSENLHRNWVTIPHVTHFDEADITELEAFRKDSQQAAQNFGTKLTPLVFMMKAAVSALAAFPSFNASIADDGAHLVLKQYFHIGVAVDTPNGLVVPVVRDVDKKGLFQLAKELGQISEKARNQQLKAEDMQGSCFTISSLGSIGGTAFTPIINAPDVAILGVPKAGMKPVFDGEQFVPRLMLPLCLSYDHRVIDGAEAARFVKHLVEQLSDIRKLLF